MKGETQQQFEARKFRGGWRRHREQFADRIRGVAGALSYNDGPAKGLLKDVAHILDDENAYVSGGKLKSVRGRSRPMSWRERIAWHVLGVLPRWSQPETGQGGRG